MGRPMHDSSQKWLLKLTILKCKILSMEEMLIKVPILYLRKGRGLQLHIWNRRTALKISVSLFMKNSVSVNI